MKKLWDFYKWGLINQKNDMIHLTFLTATILLLLGYCVVALASAVSGWPIVSGLMVLIPLALAIQVAVKKYIAEKAKP